MLTASYCGSSIVCTAMNCGPTTFQWMCLRVSDRSVRALSRAWSSSTNSWAVCWEMPGMVNGTDPRGLLVLIFF